jgi:hypothetical protein
MPPGIDRNLKGGILSALVRSPAIRCRHCRSKPMTAPINKAVPSYEQAVEPFVKTGRLGDTERAMLMGGTCAKAYGWSPKKA